MKKIELKILFPLLMLGFSGCYVKGLTSGYKKLSVEEKNSICDYATEKNCPFITINGKQIVEKLQKDPSALVYIWVPYCKSAKCLSLKFYKDYCTENNQKLYIVADSYDMESINQQVTEKDIIYFINPFYYGTNFRMGYTKKFINDLVHHKPIHDSLKYARFFYYEHGNFIRCSDTLL